MAPSVLLLLEGTGSFYPLSMGIKNFHFSPSVQQTLPGTGLIPSRDLRLQLLYPNPTHLFRRSAVSLLKARFFLHSCLFLQKN